MPGAWTTLFAKPPVSVTVVPPEDAPEAATLTPLDPLEPLLVTMFGTPVKNSAAGYVVAPVEGVPDDKWEEANFAPSELSKDLRGVFFGEFAVCPTAGPTADTPEGPSMPFTTVRPPAGPATEPKQSTVLVTVGPTEVKDVGPGTIPPVPLGGTTPYMVMPGFTL